MKKILVSIILFGILLTTTAFTQWTGTEYKVDEDTILFAWTGSSEHYEVKAIWIDPTDPFEYPLGSTTDTQITLTRPRTGHLVLAVRACNGAECSEWSESIDPTVATVEGAAGAWRIYWKVPAPGDIIIE